MTTRELERTLRHFANYLATIPEFDVEGCVSIMEGHKATDCGVVHRLITTKIFS